MTVRELMAVLIYFPTDGQDIQIRMPNGDHLDAVRVTDTHGKLTVELQGANAVRSYSRTSAQDWIAASDGKRRQVIKTITDRAEIQRITKASASRNGYQIRSSHGIHA
jgi:hypothetical protein